MDPRGVFVGSDGLRSGWRVAIFAGPGMVLTLLVAVFVGLLMVAAAAAGLEVSFEAQVFSGMVVYVVFPLWSIACSVVLDRNGALGAGLGGPATRSALELGIGWGVGGVLNGMGLALLAVLGSAGVIDGSVHMAATHLTATDLIRWAMWMAVFFLAATWEEVIFRGYGLLWAGRAVTRSLQWAAAQAGQALPETPSKVLGHGPLIALSCIAFSLIHLGNPGNSGLLPVINTTLAGLWLVIAVYRTRGLWAAIGMHWGWNATMGLILGVPVSGLGTEESGAPYPGLLSTTLTGPDWYTGAAYGLEGSIGATCALGIGCVLALFWPSSEDRPAV